MSDTPIDVAVLAELKDATGDDFAAELVSTFLDEAPGMFEALRAAAQARDADAYRRVAHSIKSNAATFGAATLANQAREMEMAALPGDGALAEIEALEHAFARAASALQELIHG